MSTTNIHTGLHPVPTGKGFYHHTSRMPHGLESNPADEDSEETVLCPMPGMFLPDPGQNEGPMASQAGTLAL